jgi:hypothetical protein
MKTAFLIIAILLLALGAAPAHAGEVLPHAVEAQLKTPLVAMGSATYRKFGFSVYRITLWTADGTWNRQKPFALELHYVRDVSKDTLVDIVMDDLREENVAGDDTLEGWHKTLNAVLPDIKQDDTIVSLYLPDKPKSPLFYNDKVILSTSDKAFMKAFVDIWLGPTADERMRGKLLLTP